MNFSGILIGVLTFFLIGLFHPIVIYAEYYFGSRCWPVFLLVGILCMILSVRMQEILWSVSLGVLGVSCFWSIKELKEQEKTLVYLDSLLQQKQGELDALKGKFTLEKDAEYQQIGNYLHPSQVIEKNLHRSYLRFQVNETGQMSMTSIYCGPSNIHHVGVKVVAPDGSFAETPASKDGYETTDLGEKIEKADFKMGEDGNVIGFLYLNKDKNIKVNYQGERSYSTTMSPIDRQALAGVYELAQILSSITQIKKEMEEANLKIEFVKRKMQEREETEQGK